MWLTAKSYNLITEAWIAVFQVQSNIFAIRNHKSSVSSWKWCMCCEYKKGFDIAHNQIKFKTQSGQ